MKKLLLTASALTALSVGMAQAVPVNIDAWDSGAGGDPLTTGDKIYTYMTSDGPGQTQWYSTTQVEATTVGSVYSFNNSGLNSVSSNFSFVFSIAIDPALGPGQVFDVSGLSVNKLLGSTANVMASIFSDSGLNNLITTSVGAGTPTPYTYTTDYTTLYIKIDSSSIAPGNVLQNLSFDVTQRAATTSVPEPASMALLGAGLLGLGLSRRRR